MADRYLTFAPPILHVVAHNELVLLDTRSNRFILYDAAATGEIMRGINGNATGPLVQELTAEGVLVASRIKTSVNRSGAPGLDDFTWSESVRYKASQHLREPSLKQVGGAVLTLAKTCLLLKCLDLSRLLAADRNASIPMRRVDRGIIDAEISALLRAARYLPCKVACLEFSLALRERLARRGLFGRVEIGVQTYSFMAHAWLELNGQPVGEPDHVSRSLHRLRGSA